MSGGTFPCHSHKRLVSNTYVTEEKGAMACLDMSEMLELTGIIQPSHILMLKIDSRIELCKKGLIKNQHASVVWDKVEELSIGRAETLSNDLLS